ncbi:hypothetical protein COY33_01880 [candidate division WWE3 bacterium CG_4_10_14_0_2_um_filter_42_7]|uniref:DUF5667 domain-containing protein n=2 Tax=Katanobacteria TaxID=422282 RepID=A0A2H0X9Y4_UNCKA|nr:MAG: hypothetical protein COT51_01130 [candidate division WWE3 bacterium CG08_land_8_20_14_0_20_41_15]PIZ43239.1 MAG: hypothetical protein COY33_01880 [candidate division WWE3 bacterium CG_4_10_14_0_2_um_filter_42_7]
MKFPRLSIFLTFLVFTIAFLFPRPARAVSLNDIFSSPDSLVVKIQEGIEYFFAFKVEQKIAVLEKHAEKRLVTAQGYAEEGDSGKVQNLLQNYLQIKERQNNLLGENTDGNVLGAVQERTIEQQKTMEEIKTKVGEDVKQEVIQVQEQVVNQVAERVIEVNGTEGQTEFFQKVEHVWAEGTGPGGEAGIVIEGGGSQFAPGTESGGQSGVVIEGGEIKFAPGTGEGAGSQQVVEEVIESGGQKVEESSSGGGGNVVVEQ